MTQESCRATRQIDEMFCAPCGLRWSIDDDPPECRASQSATPEEAALENLARMYRLRSDELKAVVDMLVTGALEQAVTLAAVIAWARSVQAQATPVYNTDEELAIAAAILRCHAIYAED